VIPGNDVFGMKSITIFTVSSVNQTPGIEPDSINEIKFKLFMNQGILNITYNYPQELEEAEVVVFNMLGQVIIRKKLENSNINQIMLPSHNTCYIVRISYAGKVYTQKIISTSN
jgi:hypothetical protein